MYKLLKDPRTNEVCAVEIIGASTSFPLNPANTDYQTFKAQINTDEAQLESADGVLMTQDEAKAFVATLP